MTACIDPYCPVAAADRRRLRGVRVARPRPRVGVPAVGRRVLARRRLLAAPLRGGARRPRRLALIDVATGRVAVVPGSGVAAGYNLVAWSADGDARLHHRRRRGARRVIVGYRLGTVRARMLDVEVGDFYDFAAT